MKKIFFLLILLSTLSVSGQTALKERLEQHVYTLAFGAEEARLVGSTYYFYHSKTPKDYIKLMLSLDIVSWYKGGTTKYIRFGAIKGGSAMILNPQFIPSGLEWRPKNMKQALCAQPTRNLLHKKRFRHFG